MVILSILPKNVIQTVSIIPNLLDLKWKRQFFNEHIEIKKNNFLLTNKKKYEWMISPKGLTLENEFCDLTEQQS